MADLEPGLAAHADAADAGVLGDPRGDVDRIVEQRIEVHELETTDADVRNGADVADDGGDSVDPFDGFGEDLQADTYSLIEKLNRVIRGTANYFATPWSNCGDMYRSLDRWIRMRLRCMKFKRKSKVDNVRVRLKHFRNMGLLNLTDLRPSGVT